MNNIFVFLLGVAVASAFWFFGEGFKFNSERDRLEVHYADGQFENEPAEEVTTESNAEALIVDKSPVLNEPDGLTEKELVGDNVAIDDEVLVTAREVKSKTVAESEIVYVPDPDQLYNERLSGSNTPMMAATQPEILAISEALLESERGDTVLIAAATQPEMQAIPEALLASERTVSRSVDFMDDSSLLPADPDDPYRPLALLSAASTNYVVAISEEQQLSEMLYEFNGSDHGPEYVEPVPEIPFVE